MKEIGDFPQPRIDAKRYPGLRFHLHAQVIVTKDSKRLWRRLAV